MSNRNNGNNGGASGIGVTGLLGVAFIVLKLCGVIDWPWLWVLSPFWISVLLAVILVIVIVLLDK